MVHVGIDLGTSNTVVSYFENGELKEHQIDNADLIPSVIYVEEQAGRRTVGRAAVEEWADPDFSAASSFRRWKLSMGENRVLGELAVGGGKKKTPITPEQLTTWLVEYVVGTIADGVGGRAVESAVVTVPHGWRREHPERSAATRSAAAAAVVAGKPLTIRDLTLSEPVAAAGYWLWEARRDPAHLADEFVGRTILVVDIGGGTFDLSLVRVGPPETPLVVVDANNNDIAGDFASALILARATARANDELGTEFPTDAGELLQLLSSGETAWIRSWFLTAENAVREISSRIARATARGRGEPVPLRLSFELPDGEVSIQISKAEFHATLQPFYQAGRELLRNFLAMQAPDDLPHGVVFAGGGSRIEGIVDQIVLPALEDRELPDPREVLGRIAMNDRRVDRAVALGAALVAAGEIQVEERLLYDVGIEIKVPSRIARKLGVGNASTSVVVSPILARASKLPASASSKAVIGNMSIAPGESYDFKIVVFDDLTEPFVQTWSQKHPAGGSRAEVSVQLTADTDGLLTVDINLENGAGRQTVTGAISRKRGGRAYIELGEGDAPPLHRVTPDELRKAVAAEKGAR